MRTILLLCYRQYRRLLLGGLILTPFFVQADAISLYVNGNIIASPCVVEGGSDINIDLGQELLTSAVNAIDYGDKESDWKNFTINLKDCPSSKESVIATFHGTPGSHPTLYANTGDAGNVEVELRTQDGESPMGNGMEHWATIKSDRSAAFTLKARAVSPARNATPGSIAAVVTMSFTYN
ncbi:fimbrial protein [Enterobacillus tribolii]|uniref:Minor fimbrial subunit n=1 Tax=Enterobacillus tribolii TaxID=1487935 RepID=A0A370QNX7_9GAMM|nr:fimbrial protein [Enterobacillus tribolii]MBW7981905.1 type 1 fimbrial protein [Enterobacillus tribolii]RDK90074.1 minor fimbrial subunit [Enterobacillus tribolii]